MNQFCKLKENLEFDYQLASMVPMEWDDTHFCTPESLTQEEKDYFRIVPLIVVQPPEFNPHTHSCVRDGAELVNGQWQYKWLVTPLTQETIDANLAQAKKDFLRLTDHDVDKIYSDVIGNRGTEYSQAEKEAIEYKAAGYPSNPVPQSVGSFAIAKSWTPTQAADDIIAQATAWRNAAAAIRANRLKEKEAARLATNQEELAIVVNRWNNFNLYIRNALGI